MLPVGFGVGRVYKLSGNKAARNLLRQLLCLGNGALHAFRALRKHQLRAVCLHQLSALHGHGFRHNNDNGVSPGCGHTGKTDSRIAACRLNNPRLLCKLSRQLRLIQHLLCHPVLYGTGGIKVFQLGNNPGFQTQFLLHM